MYFTAIVGDENLEKYKQINVEGRVFYYLLPETTVPVKTNKKRYSDQFKDPIFMAKDTYRKLKMIKQFNLKYKDIGCQTEKYISCIEDSIWLLKREFSVEPKTIFHSFNLNRLGFNPEDYGINENPADEEQD